MSGLFDQPSQRGAVPQLRALSIQLMTLRRGLVQSPAPDGVIILQATFHFGLHWLSLLYVIIWLRRPHMLLFHDFSHSALALCPQLILLALVEHAVIADFESIQKQLTGNMLRSVPQQLRCFKIACLIY